MKTFLYWIAGLGIGVVGALLFIHGQDVQKSYARVDGTFTFVSDLDRRRAEPINRLLAVTQEHGHVDSVSRLVLYLAVKDIDPIPNLSLRSSPIDFEIYARHQLRVSEKLSHVTQIAYGDPDILTVPSLSMIQSRVEGTEAAALSAQMSYNEAVNDYEMLLRDWPNARLATVMRLPAPRDLPRFTTYGEAGPANQEWQLRAGGKMPSKDDDDD